GPTASRTPSARSRSSLPIRKSSAKLCGVVLRGMPLMRRIFALAIVAVAALAPPVRAQPAPSFPYHLGMTVEAVQAIAPSWHWEAFSKSYDRAHGHPNEPDGMSNGPPLTVDGVSFSPSLLQFDDNRRLTMADFLTPTTYVPPDACLGQAGRTISSLVS